MLMKFPKNLNFGNISKKCIRVTGSLLVYLKHVNFLKISISLLVFTCVYLCLLVVLVLPSRHLCCENKRLQQPEYS